jgi:hypothetical protein
MILEKLYNDINISKYHFSISDETFQLTKRISSSIHTSKYFLISSILFDKHHKVIEVNNNDYLIVTGNVIFKKYVTIEKTYKLKKFLWVFNYRKIIYDTDDDAILEKIDELRNSKEYRNKIVINCEKDYDPIYNKPFYSFKIPVFFIVSDNKYEELGKFEYYKLKKTIKSATVYRKLMILRNKVDKQIITHLKEISQ